MATPAEHVAVGIQGTKPSLSRDLGDAASGQREPPASVADAGTAVTTTAVMATVSSGGHLGQGLSGYSRAPGGVRGSSSGAHLVLAAGAVDEVVRRSTGEFGGGVAAAGHLAAGPGATGFEGAFRGPGLLGNRTARNSRAHDDLFASAASPRPRPLPAWTAPELAHFMLQYRDLRPEDFDLLCKLDDGVPRRGTLPAKLVDSLPHLQARECDADECGVCLFRLTPETTVARLPCRHAFHSGCISRWLTECKGTCPLCATPVSCGISNAGAGASAAVDLGQGTALPQPGGWAD